MSPEFWRPCKLVLITLWYRCLNACSKGWCFLLPSLNFLLLVIVDYGLLQLFCHANVTPVAQFSPSPTSSPRLQSADQQDAPYPGAALLTPGGSGFRKTSSREDDWSCTVSLVIVEFSNSGSSGNPNPNPKFSGTRIVGFWFLSANFGFYFSKPEIFKTRNTRPELFG